ncbi:uncharacterized protein LOC124267986 [Haliotis rubra]|uniref:uncharacterized protein LOC124267986 n=1 Tax=Haliotis rubra TaxID=36100 RepID=UPI001EE516F9|nr:uncharacterized protein LOC124267986 [Haliotis rubra]
MWTLMYLLLMFTTCCLTHNTVEQIKENMKSYAKDYLIQYYVPYVNTQPDEAKLKLLKHLEDNLLLITGMDDKEGAEGMDTQPKGLGKVTTDEDKLGHKIRGLSNKVESNDGLLVIDAKNLMRAVSRDVEDSLDQKVRSLSNKVESNDGLLVSNPQNLMKAVSRDVEDSLKQKIRRLSNKVDSNDGLLVFNPQNLMRAVSRDV